MKAEIKAELESYLKGLLEILGDSAEIQIKRETDREIYINLQGFSSLDGSDPKPLRSMSLWGRYPKGLTPIGLKHLMMIVSQKNYNSRQSSCKSL